MKKITALFIFILLSSGCSSIGNVTTPNRERLLKLSPGMEQKEVLRLMGTRRMVAKPDLFETLIINNPYRSEILEDKNGKYYEILYYLTDNKFDDNVIKEDDFTPLVFSSDKILLGWGQSFLKDFIDRNQIKNIKQSTASEKKKSSFGKSKKIK